MKGLRFQDICDRLCEVLALTSLTLKAFMTLLPDFERSFLEHMSQWCINGKKRTDRRALIVYKNCPLPVPGDRLLFILYFLKNNPLQTAHGRTFGMLQCKANIWIHLLLGVLRSTLSGLNHIPCRTISELAKRLGTSHEEAHSIVEPFVAASSGPSVLPSGEHNTLNEPSVPAPPTGASLFCHDGMERRIQRPKDAQQQTLNYSGKKKTHTVKNVLLANQTQKVIFLSDTVAGKTHDKKIADATPYPLPAGSTLLQDLGFQGFHLEDVNIIMPTKKPRGGELTPEQKGTNRHISRRRVAIEHINSGVKRCRVIKDTLRLLKDGIRDLVIEVCCALHNFRVDLVPWKPML